MRTCLENFKYVRVKKYIYIMCCNKKKLFNLTQVTQLNENSISIDNGTMHCQTSFILFNTLNPTTPK